jgi:hypothetical protein
MGNAAPKPQPLAPGLPPIPNQLLPAQGGQVVPPTEDIGHDVIRVIKDWAPIAMEIGNAVQDRINGLDGNCFPAGTLVDTSTGLQRIETIKAGQEVWAYDLIAGCWRACRVLETFSRLYEGNSTFVKVAGETIESTLLHPYWVVSGEALPDRPRRKHLHPVPETSKTPGRWVDAGDLRVGDELLIRDGRIVNVEAVRSAPFVDKVYNILVDDLHSYAVGQHGVLVHNENGAEEASKPNPVKIPKHIIQEMGGETTIAQIKNDVLGDGTNPDLHWDPKTGEIYVPLPGGGFSATGHFVGDYPD